MEMNIKVTISDEQLDLMTERGGLSINVPLEAISVYDENSWPVVFDNEKADRLINVAKDFGLCSSELQKLSLLRVSHILGIDPSMAEYEIEKVEEALQVKFVRDASLDGVLSARVTNGLKKAEGVTTLADLMTVPMDEIAHIKGLGESSLEEVESIFVKMREDLR